MDINGASACFNPNLTEPPHLVATFTLGDRVQARALPADEASRLMREGGGEWAADMAGCLGRAGVVGELDPASSMLSVKFENGKNVAWVPVLLEFARASKELKMGSEVRIRHVSVEEGEWGWEKERVAPCAWYWRTVASLPTYCRLIANLSISTDAHR